jgi:hypothetical protein
VSAVNQGERDWVEQEFKTVDLGDERLNKRLKIIAADEGAQPSAPLNQASGDWAATKAAYRFFKNEKVTAAELLAPHQGETQKRMRGQALVLAVQDTTYLNYTSHQATQGLGTIGGQQVGLVMHPTMALTAGGVPLGLITQQIWARSEPEPSPDPDERPIEDAIWLEPLELWGVLLQEVNPPVGATPVEWLLLTNVAVPSWQDALERVRWYCLRWGIEVWHKILKSGCTVEDCRLETAERLTRYLSLMSVIAWRLFWLTHISRHDPDAPCTTILADHEWKALYCAIHRTNQLPVQFPSVRQAVRWIAQLGGFLARTADLDPGITTIWRGWTRLTDMAALWLLLHPDSTYG